MQTKYHRPDATSRLEKPQLAKCLTLIAVQNAGCDRRELAAHVLLIPCDAGNARLLERVEKIVERAFVGDDADDEVGMGFVWIAVRIGCSENGVSDLNREVRLRDVGSADRVDVADFGLRFAFDSQHGYLLKNGVA